jgi:outer membrane protein insertion porin family
VNSGELVKALAASGRILVLALAVSLAVSLSGCARGREELAMEQTALRELRFEGNRAFSASRLAGVITDEVGDLKRAGYKRSTVDDAAFALEQFHASQGFPSTRVDYEFLDPPEDGVHVVFRIDEGPRVELAQIELAGVERSRRDEVRAFFEPPRSMLLERSRRWFVLREIESAVRAASAWYYTHGFLEVEVSDPEVTFDEARTKATVRVEVREGVQSILRAIHLLREGTDAEEALQESHEVREFLGRPWSPQVGSAIRGSVLEAYKRRGRPEASARIAEVSRGENGDVEVTLRIEPGPQIVIAGVRILGNHKTRTHTIRSRIAFEPGEIYDVEQERDSFRELYRTGLFSTVRIGLAKPDEVPPSAQQESPQPETPTANAPTQPPPEQPPAEQAPVAQAPPAQAPAAQAPAAPTAGTPPAAEETETRVLEVEVSEASSQEFYVEPGYGSYERLRLSLGWREKNLWGTGRILNIEGTLAELAQRGLIGLTDTRLLGSRISGTLSLFGNHREEPSFTHRELGSGLTFSRRFPEWSEHLQASLGYQFRRSDVLDVKVVDPTVIAALTDVDVSSVNFTPTYDTRDDPFLPKKGNLSRITVEYADGAIGSQLEFVRTRITQSDFFQLREGMVLGLSYRGGFIAPIKGTTTLPLQEQFFNGGENTVRSFREDELGPVDVQGNPIGGEAFNVFSAELRQRLSTRFEGALFYDTGNLETDYTDYLRFSDMRSAIGAGLRYVLPVGPIRLDVGVNPDPRQGESDYVVHLSVGMAF